MARLDKEKRIDQLLKIAVELQNQIKFKWYVIGDGPDRKELEELKNKLGLDDCIEFLGYLENPYSVMSHCDTLVLLSKYEGTPVTIDEAMVLGLGIVAPRIGGIAEQTGKYENCILIHKDEEFANVLSKSLKTLNVYNYKISNEKKIKVK